MSSRSRNQQGKQVTRLSNFFLFLGLLFFVIMWLVEINFHYLQGFTPQDIENQELFWKAEYAQVTNTLIFLAFSIIFIIIGIRMRSKTRKR